MFQTPNRRDSLYEFVGLKIYNIVWCAILMQRCYVCWDDTNNRSPCTCRAHICRECEKKLVAPHCTICRGLFFHFAVFYNIYFTLAVLKQIATTIVVAALVGRAQIIVEGLMVATVCTFLQAILRAAAG